MDLKTCLWGAVPFAAMVMVECTDVGITTLSKAAMLKGMNNFVFVVYYNALGTFILIPQFIFNRSNRPPLTFSILCRFFLLGLIGICLEQTLAFTGISYSSPTLASAMGNLVPAYTFVLAIIFRMEKLDLRNSSSQAKTLGTIVSIAGAFIVTLCKGPPILLAPSYFKPSNFPLITAQSNWVLGGLLLAITSFLAAIWNVIQAATVKQYPHEMTIVFFYGFFGTIQCAILSLIVERNPSAWRLRADIELLAIVYAAIFGSIFHYGVHTWCLKEKGILYVAMFKPLGIAIAVIMGAIFLGDALHVGSVIGAIIIAVGFYAVMWGQAKEKEMGQDSVVCSLESSNLKTPLL